MDNISDFLKSDDLVDILEIAETVAMVLPIPYLPSIIRVLTVLVKAQPLVQSKSNIDSTKSLSSDNKEKFKRLFDIAMDDGVITDEEKEILRPCAQKAGYSDEEFEMMVLAKKVL